MLATFQVLSEDIWLVLRLFLAEYAEILFLFSIVYVHLCSA